MSSFECLIVTPLLFIFTRDVIIMTELHGEMEKRFQYRFGSIEYDLSSRTHIVGVLNITPDSFFDGGKYLNAVAAVDHAVRMVEEGADIIDVGGESTRPGSDPLRAEDELLRVLPVIEKLATRVNVPISIDTYKSAVARKALEAGASIINDVSGLTFDPLLIDVAAESRATVIVMHMKGTPKSMQENPQYEDVIAEIKSFLSSRALAAEAAGIRQIIVDPGIGFGKTLEHNLDIFRHLDAFTDLGYPVMVGPSRKSFLGMILKLPVESRLEGTAAAVAVSILNGAQLIRVHDVQAMKRVAMVVDAIKRGAEVRAPV
jgi:dihydropteroate synthase